MRVEGPLIVAQLLETTLLTLVNFARYGTRLNRPRSAYSLFTFLGPDFELSNSRNAYKTSTNVNETSQICFSCANP